MKIISSLARVIKKVVGIGFFFIWVEVRFFNVATNKANCDWLTSILKMAQAITKQNHKYPNSFCLKESAGPGVRKLHKYYLCHRLWSSRQAFPDIGYWECASYTNNTMLAMLSKKMKVIRPTLSKELHNFIRKTKNYLKKTEMT